VVTVKTFQMNVVCSGYFCTSVFHCLALNTVLFFQACL